MENCLVNKKVNVVPIIRDGKWLPKGHDGNFLFSGTAIELEVKMDPKTGMIDPLYGVTENTKKEIVEAFALDSLKDLNVHKKENNFWTDRKRTVKIDKNGLWLDLSNPVDFLRYRILCGYTDNFIAPSWEERKNRLTYVFAFKDEDTVMEISAISEKDKIAAYTKFGQMQTNVYDMYDFLLVYYYIGKNKDMFPHFSWSTEKYLDKIGGIIEKNLEKFITIIQDKNYKYKVLIYRALNLGYLEIVSKNKYQVKGSDTPIGILEDTIKYYTDKKNNQEYLTLKAKVEEKAREAKV